MGITIHFTGVAKSIKHCLDMVVLARNFSAEQAWSVVNVNEPEVELVRTAGEEQISYKGPVHGIVLLPADTCEPIYLVFDSNLLVQDYVKTQFAGPDTHIQVIELFRMLEPHFASFEILDEGLYWNTSDRELLQIEMEKVNEMLLAVLQDNPEAKGPIKLASGRIVDVIK